MHQPGARLQVEQASLVVVCSKQGCRLPAQSALVGSVQNTAFPVKACVPWTEHWLYSWSTLAGSLLRSNSEPAHTHPQPGASAQQVCTRACTPYSTCSSCALYHKRQGRWRCPTAPTDAPPSPDAGLADRDSRDVLRTPTPCKCMHAKQMGAAHTAPPVAHICTAHP